MTAAPQSCDSHLDRFSFDHRLPHFEEALGRQRKIKIVTIGSSSTAGESDIIPFPHRLELGLRSSYPGRMIDVINRGIGGQEAPEELSRFECDVMIELPILVIWQVGTNAIYHNSYQPPDIAGTVATGLSWLKGLPADVIMMDLQYAPALFQDQHGNPDPQQEAKTSADGGLDLSGCKGRQRERIPTFRTDGTLGKGRQDRLERSDCQ